MLTIENVCRSTPRLRCPQGPRSTPSGISPSPLPSERETAGERGPSHASGSWRENPPRPIPSVLHSFAPVCTKVFPPALPLVPPLRAESGNWTVQFRGFPYFPAIPVKASQGQSTQKTSGGVLTYSQPTYQQPRITI
jgi:hypothetical protein